MTRQRRRRLLHAKICLVHEAVRRPASPASDSATNSRARQIKSGTTRRKTPPGSSKLEASINAAPWAFLRKEASPPASAGAPFDALAL
jgi:hypothetical protein